MVLTFTLWTRSGCYSSSLHVEIKMGRSRERKSQATFLSLFILTKRIHAFPECILFSNLLSFYLTDQNCVMWTASGSMRLGKCYICDVILSFCGLLLSHKTVFSVFIQVGACRSWYILTTLCVPLDTAGYLPTSRWKAFRLCLSIDFLQKQTPRQGCESRLFGRLEGDSSKHWQGSGDVRQPRERNQ